jgi:mRNA-degrading endonuclease toxin of MazEF toxin-antitoxin module
MIVHRRAHIYWVRMPSERKRRPAVVLSADRRNQLADTVVVAPMSTVPRRGRWNVGLRKGEGGLPHDSVIKCEEITTLLKDKLEPTSLGGPLSSERLAEIRTALLCALDFE